MYIGINGKTGILSSSVKSQFHKKNSIKIKSQSSSVRSRSSPRSERCFSPIHNGAKSLFKKPYLINSCLFVCLFVYLIWGLDSLATLHTYILVKEVMIITAARSFYEIFPIFKWKSSITRISHKKIPYWFFPFAKPVLVWNFTINFHLYFSL